MPYKMDVALAVVERIGKSLEPQFTLTPEAESIYRILIQWFHGDPGFEKNGYLSKGIMLMGPTGTGKTLAMKIMSVYRGIDNIMFLIDGRFYKLSYDVIDVNNIVNSFVQSGYEGIGVYNTRVALCLDDLGSESEYVRRFGNKVDVISYIISERHLRRLLTLGTSNFPLATLEEKYDDRVVSRMYGMFNFLTMKGQDFRRRQTKSSNQ